MNKYVRALFVVPFGIIKMGWTKLFHPKNFHGTVACMISPSAEISMERNARLFIGYGFKMRDGAKLRVRDGGECVIGIHTSVNSNNVIACHESIRIGSHVQLSPNVQIYDHDHDFRADGGIASMKYKCAPIEIGDNVWIGANTVILRGTTIGNGSVVGAGCVLKGNYPANSIIVQKRDTIVAPKE